MLIHNLIFHFVFTLLIQTSQSKPLHDGEFARSYYRTLSDNVDQNLKYVETGTVKPKVLNQDDVPTTPDPLPIMPTTSLIDTKLDEELEDVNSNSEEEDDQKSKLSNDIPPASDHDPNEKLLSVEEHENNMVFDEKHEILAKKQIPQIIKTANTPPTILPQTSSVPKPTQTEPPTTPLTNQESKNSKKHLDDKNEAKQKLITTTEKSKQQPQSIDEKPPSHIDRMLAHQVRDEMEENDQNFDAKSRINQGGIIYGGQLPEIEIDGQTPISIDATTPKTIEETTPKPAEAKQNSVLDRVFQAVLCTRGDCTDVFMPTTEQPNPRELKEMTIIRRVRHDEGIIEVECKCGKKKPS